MDQFIVNLEPGADKVLLRKMIKNLKGIGEVILKKDVDSSKKTKAILKSDNKTQEWIQQMLDLSNSFDSKLVDLNDEKTRYILSK